MTIDITCPTCKNFLLKNKDSYKCPNCGGSYEIKNNVVCLLADADDFYENAYTATTNITFSDDYNSLKARLFFDIYRDPYFYAIRKYSRSLHKILDVGCGGGVRYLAQKGAVAGLDISFGSLKKVSSFYSIATKASALDMPFANDTFNLIVSSYNFEHFHPSEKSILLSEIFRILKPDGRLIFLFDCDNNNFLFRYFKRDSILYKQNIIDKDKHCGLELASKNIERFCFSGFTVEEAIGLNKTALQNLAVYSWLEPYSSKSIVVKYVCNFALFISKYKILWVGYNLFLNWFDRIIEKALPLDHSRILLIVAKKPRGE